MPCGSEISRHGVLVGLRKALARLLNSIAIQRKVRMYSAGLTAGVAIVLHSRGGTEVEIVNEFDAARPMALEREVANLVVGSTIRRMAIINQNDSMPTTRPRRAICKRTGTQKSLSSAAAATPSAKSSKFTTLSFSLIARRPGRACIDSVHPTPPPKLANSRPPHTPSKVGELASTDGGDHDQRRTISVLAVSSNAAAGRSLQFVEARVPLLG